MNPAKKRPDPLESFSDDDLAYLIHVRLRAMQGHASIKKVSQMKPLNSNRA